MKKRNIAFAYRMENGRIVAEPCEAKIVQQIFADYICGISYQKIADKLSRGTVCYSYTSNLWNKNMVKRILENEKYTGADGYPLLINSGTFERARHLRLDKRQEYKVPLAHLKALRGKILCCACGVAIIRKTNTQPMNWVCGNEECGTFAASDEHLFSGITALINQLIAKPSLIEIPPVDISIQNDEIMRINNSLYRLLEARECDEECALEAINKAANEKYNACDSGENAAAGKHLRDVFSAKELLNGFDDKLFNTTVKNVVAHSDGKLKIMLKNGQLFPA